MGAGDTDKVLTVYVSTLDPEKEGFILNTNEEIFLENKIECSMWEWHLNIDIKPVTALQTSETSPQSTSPRPPPHQWRTSLHSELCLSRIFIPNPRVSLVRLCVVVYTGLCSTLLRNHGYNGDVPWPSLECMTRYDPCIRKVLIRGT